MPRATRLTPVAVALGVTLLAPLAPGAAGTSTSPAEAARGLCEGRTRTTGALADPELVETSGLAWSRSHRGVLWAHNDSGDLPRVFALGRDGSSLGTVAVTGADALDWEDVAIGEGPGGRDHLFLADTGPRSTVAIARIPEPTPPGPGSTTASAEAAIVTLTYPDGARDAEALAVDERTGDLVVVTKGGAAPATVYRAPGAATARSGSTLALEAVGPVGRPDDPAPNRLLLEIAGLGEAADLVTGADASAARGVAVVRTYGGTAVFRWPARTTLAEALLGVPCAAPAPLDPRAPQGEAIALSPNGRRLVTVSEGVRAPLVELRAAD